MTSDSVVGRFVSTVGGLLLLAGFLTGSPARVAAEPPTVSVPEDRMKILRGRDYREHLTDAFWSAENRVLIASMLVSEPKSRTMRQLYNVLSARTEAGVTVKVLTASQHDFGRFNEAPLAFINEQEGMEGRLYNGEGMMHSKIVVVDGDLVYNGSANFTASGIGRTEETTIFVKNERLAESFAEYFDEMWSSAMTLQQLRERRGQ